MTMNAVKGIYRNGQIILKSPTDWPEDCEVIVEPVVKEQTYGIRDEDWPTDQKGIAVLAASMGEFRPVEMTPEEEADLAAWRQKIKEYEIAKMQQRIEGLFP
jgi:hypothetical protein